MQRLTHMGGVYFHENVLPVVLLLRGHRTILAAEPLRDLQEPRGQLGTGACQILGHVAALGFCQIACFCDVSRRVASQQVKVSERPILTGICDCSDEHTEHRGSNSYYTIPHDVRSFL